MWNMRGARHLSRTVGKHKTRVASSVFSHEDYQIVSNCGNQLKSVCTATTPWLPFHCNPQTLNNMYTAKRRDVFGGWNLLDLRKSLGGQRCTTQYIPPLGSVHIQPSSTTSGRNQPKFSCHVDSFWSCNLPLEQKYKLEQCVNPVQESLQFTPCWRSI